MSSAAHPPQAGDLVEEFRDIGDPMSAIRLRILWVAYLHLAVVLRAA